MKWKIIKFMLYYYIIILFVCSNSEVQKSETSAENKIDYLIFNTF